MKNLKPVALVTGAGGGIGSAVVIKLAMQGYDIALAELNEFTIEDVLKKIDSLQSDTQINVQAFLGNLTNTSYCDFLPQQVFDSFGRLDLLVNNAGLMRRGDITQTSDDDYALSMSVNVEAPFRLCRSVVPIMTEQGSGTIVNVASCWGMYPGPNHLIYCTTKAAVAAMTKCLARDHAKDNIRVNAVCPNEVNTPMLRTGFEIRGLDPDKAVSELNESVPLGRIAEPEDIADVVAFLASDESRYMCGALLEVNGAKPVY